METTIKQNRTSDNPFSSLFSNNVIQPTVYSTTNVYNMKLYGEIGAPADYADYVDILDTANVNDIVNIYINTPGGNLLTAISLIHAINRTQAEVIAHADGEVASAGTMIFFSCENKIVYPYSMFMFHDASMSSFGKLSESVKNVEATSKLIKRMAYDLYSPYFTDEEIDDILTGRDYYCDSDEIYDRIKTIHDQYEEERDVQGEDIE